MGKTKAEKRKAERKIKQKDRRKKYASFLNKEKAGDLFYEALWEMDEGRLEDALFFVEKALRLDSKNNEYLETLGYLGQQLNRADVEMKALLGVYANGVIRPDQMFTLCKLLSVTGRYEQALGIIEETLPLVTKIKGGNKKIQKELLLKEQQYCIKRLEAAKKPAADTMAKAARKPRYEKVKADIREEMALAPESADKHIPVPQIPVSIEVDPRPLKDTISRGASSSIEDYELALQGYGIRFKETFDSLICLNSLREVRSLWYQEETARKVLKTFRGRALLADEVGLGKTIEALMVLKEYIQRGMVKNVLILTPSPLVSQWQEELKAKFDLSFSSTDDPDYRKMGRSFWDQPFILTSINLAKSKRNFQVVTEREYDMVIVDEAHHLKNRNTLNWKLVNALKKRFLVLLTATPVENNLMELYNLVTLLKPGQLKTASEFRKEFMTRGDPTDPQNRTRLKGLLADVMIRNTRALANIDIPPRFAQTVKVETSKAELALYKRISALARDLNTTDGKGHKFLPKNLLEEAGSSPRAVSLTLSRLLEKKDMLLRHKQEISAINNMCRALEENSKNKFLLKLIKKSPGKMIVFVKYLGTLDHISKFLELHDIPFAMFHGRMNNQTKDKQIEHFRKGRDILVTTEIGGEGRNLQFCHQMVNYDLPWNPMKIEQRIGRIHRIGQEREVSIYNLCAANSVEDFILEILDKKINMFEMVIGEIDMVLGRMWREQDFSEVIYDIWMNSKTDEDRKTGFNKLGNMMKRAKTGYQKTRTLDEKLFGENYEL
ncbi:MAG: SNF2-related protein [Thermodesulfobacteriota bacterium]|nr:SNF2-related protein [Thermodesulfobacteriota bacterium]